MLWILVALACNGKGDDSAGSESDADTAGAAALHHEQRDQQRQRGRQYVLLQFRSCDFQPLDRADH